MKKIFAVVAIMTMLVGFVGCGATEQTYEAEPEYNSNGEIKETGYEPYRELVNTNKSIIVSDGDSFAEIDIYTSNEGYLYRYNGQYYQTEEEAKAAAKFN